MAPSLDQDRRNKTYRKMMKYLAVLCLMVGSSLAATTVETLAGDPNMSTLVSLVTKAGLVDAINGGTFTIFAPTNAAFAKIPSATLTALGNDNDALTNILTYHVVQGSIRKNDATNEQKLTTLNKQQIRFNIYNHNHVDTIQGSKITIFDKIASNGVIHVIDTVMMPPEGDIVDIVAKTSEVSTLLSLVQQAGIASVLQQDGLTVFAPTNAAFAALPSTISNRLAHDKRLLTDVLEYHVIHHTEYSAGLYNREFVRTEDNHQDRIQVHTDSSGVRINRNGHVIKADIGATNGVIHLIDHVLIPARDYIPLIIGRK